MKHKNFKITIEDFLKANRKAAREEEIEKKNYKIDENI